MQLQLRYPFSKINQTWPTAVTDCINQARAKKIITQPTAWKWKLVWCVEGRSLSFTEIFQTKSPVQNTIQGLQDDMQNRVQASLCAHAAPRRFFLRQTNSLSN
jgi:hypothetical protein